MRYTVVWLRLAENQLAEIWLTATDRQAISRGANEIHRHLLFRPLECDEILNHGFFVLNVGPANVLYDINEDDRKVTVYQAWLAEFDHQHGSSP